MANLNVDVSVQAVKVQSGLCGSQRPAFLNAVMNNTIKMGEGVVMN